ncbi:MAG TPA: universal stress protein UspA [Ruminiclostridium sp.]|nr:universal stress protein UspA [Ruminiclostridium sp.]
MNTYHSILVCVTQQKACERLIRAAVELKEADGNLHVIHVTKENWNFVDNARDGEVLEYLFTLSKSYGAELTILNSDKIPETIAQYAQHYGIELIMIGEGPQGNQSSFIKRLSSLLKDTDTMIMSLPSPCG